MLGFWRHIRFSDGADISNNTETKTSLHATKTIKMAAADSTILTAFSSKTKHRIQKVENTIDDKLYKVYNDTKNILRHISQFCAHWMKVNSIENNKNGSRKNVHGRHNSLFSFKLRLQ